MLKFSMLLQAIDRVTGPAKRIQASVKGMTRGITEMSGKTKAAAAPAARLAGLNQRLGAGFTAAGRAAKRWAGRAGLGSWGDAAEKAGFGVGRLAKKMGGMALGAAKWAAAGAGAAGGFAIFDLFKTAAQFEQFQIMLENMEGSSAAAKRSFDWVKQFAQTTPYELADVMESFVKLKAYGIDPMDGSLRAMGDAAAGMSKPLEAAVEAVADAMQGENERLKEFGITASVAGDKITYTYRKAGKELHVVTRKGLEAKKALTGIFNDRFGGMMERQSKTLTGMISNLKDSWSNFLMMVADAGIFDLVKGKIGGILAKVNEWAKNGKLKAWAEKVSVWLEKAFNWATNFIEQTDWAKVGDSIANVAKLVAAVANGLSNAYKWATLLGAVDAWSDRAFTGAAPGAAPGRANRDRQMTGGSAVSARPGAFGPKWPTGPALPPRQFMKKTAANDTRVGGAVRIILEARDGTAARVASISSDNRNVPVSVQVGRTMAGAA